MSVLIRRGDVSAFVDDVTVTGPLDIRIASGRIVEVAPGIPAEPGDEVIDAGGGSVIPGLHDHHVHLRALAAAQTSVPAGPPAVRSSDELARSLAAAASSLPPGHWVRAVGYHPSVAGDLDRWSVDRLCAHRPVRIQHAGGALWIVNSRAIEALAVDGGAPAGVERDATGRPTGRIWREDRWLAEHVPTVVTDLRSVSTRAAARGVTGFTDATPGSGRSDVESMQAAAAAGDVAQRLHLMADVGTPAPSASLVTLGPVKVVLDDTALPGLDDLAALVGAAHAEGRPVAVHCVTRTQGVLAVAAIEQAGSRRGDRIEHGAVLAADLLPRLRRLGITVVTQPGLVAERGDRYLADVDPSDQEDLWRMASLWSAGVDVAGSTDAPFGPCDPWEVMRVAMTRRTPSGKTIGPAEVITASTALRLFAGRYDDPARLRRVQRGQPGDLCVLRDRLETSTAELHAPEILATIVGGRVVHRAGPG